MTNKAPITIPDRQYCIAETCDILNISRETLRKYTYSEDIICIRVSAREIYYTGQEIMDFWAKMQTRKMNRYKS